jgi:hypothetical protein
VLCGAGPAWRVGEEEGPTRSSSARCAAKRGRNEKEGRKKKGKRERKKRKEEKRKRKEREKRKEEKKIGIGKEKEKK